MKRVIFHSLAISAFSVFLTAGQVKAQDGTVHGASILPLVGGGCYYTADNTPVLNPFLEPSGPNAIYCKSGFVNKITYQGEGPTSIPGVGQTTFPPASKGVFQDQLENKYAAMALASEHSSCGGQSCYPGAPNDGAFRLGFLELVLKNTVKARNAKDEPNENLAFRMAASFIANGKGVGYEIEGGKDLVSLKKGESRSIEIFPLAPDLSDEAALINEAVNPYAIDWVKPDISTTPHKEVVGGITFSSKFTGGRWHYYVNVNSEVLPGIGKYMINFILVRKLPVAVAFRYRDASYHQQYCGASPNACSRNFEPYTIGTFSIAYGTEECLKLGGVALPSYAPLMKVYSDALTLMNKNFKTVFGPLNKIGNNDRNRLKAREVRRQLTQGKTYLNEANGFEATNLKALAEFYTASELGSLSEQLLARATNAIAKTTKTNQKKDATGLPRLTRNFLRSIGFVKQNVKNGPTIAKKLKKIEAELKKLGKDANVAYDKYSLAMKLAIQKDREIRENSFRCSEVF